jgi:hypothetical protein
MSTLKRQMILINVIGGIAVLGSYAWGIAMNPDTKGAVWGGVPASLQPLYTVSMFTAAIGYLVFTGWLLFGVDDDRLGDEAPSFFSNLRLLYVLVLLPSALWMPLTFQMVEAPSPALWWLIKIVLFTVGAGSLGLLVAVARMRLSTGSAWGWAAVAGGAAFCFQTAVLDALVWTTYYPTLA